MHTLFKKKEAAYSPPSFPFLCLTVSGGHTQIVLVKSPLDLEIIGQTIDDAIGEAFDKAGKLLGLGYPAGPLIDRYAQKGTDHKYHFTFPKVSDLNYSFSGLKTQFLYFLNKEKNKNPLFIKQELNDICASYQSHLIDYLLIKFKLALEMYPCKDIAIAGGVSANSHLRKKFTKLGAQKGTKCTYTKNEFLYG